MGSFVDEINHISNQCEKHKDDKNIGNCENCPFPHCVIEEGQSESK